jgi:D-inositol-3-phosphate glycosyltransferase
MTFDQLFPAAHPLDRRAHALERGLDGLLPRPRRVCLLSVHTCPLAAPGGKETGGMNVYVRELARQLGRRGYLVDAFTRSESGEVPHIADTDLGPNVRVIHIVAGPEEHATKNETWRHAPCFAEAVLAFMGEEGITYDLYHSHYWISGWVAARLAGVHPAPIIHMYHTLGVAKDLARGAGSVPEVDERRAVEADIAAVADAIVAGSPHDEAMLVDHYGVDPAKIHVIPPGVDLDLFRPIPQEAALSYLGEGPEHRMVLFVGRLDPIKGLDTLMRAMAIVVSQDPGYRRNACLCIAGGQKTDNVAVMDAERRRIERLRIELGLGDLVHFLGSVAQDDLPYYYNAAQVVVVPSRYESFGMVALEAMACGTPVIASNVGGLATLVRDGRTGFLVRDGDPEALAGRLLPLMQDPALRRALGQHGVATAEAYAWPVIADRVEALYERVLASGAERRAPGARVVRQSGGRESVC